MRKVTMKPGMKEPLVLRLANIFTCFSGEIRPEFMKGNNETLVEVLQRFCFFPIFIRFSSYAKK